MDLVFHIGCEKTGTTSVQSWFDANDAILRDHGIWYAQAFGRANNRGIMFYGLLPGTSDDQLRNTGIETEEQHIALQARIAQEFAADIAAAREAGARTYVISNEHCQSRLKTHEMVQRTHDLLAPHFDRMEIHCFVRPQIDMSLSLASTLSRNRNIVDRDWIDRDMNPNFPYYRFDLLLRRWADVYGQDTIFPVSFRAQRDSVGYFQSRLGLDAVQLDRQPVVNAALDYRTITLINALVRAGYGERKLDYASRIFVNDLPIEQRLTLDRATAMRLQQRFDTVNQELIAAFPQLVIEDLTPDWSKYPETGNIERIHEADNVGDMLCAMIDRIRAETCFEKARRLAMQSERESRANRPDTSLSAAREALRYATLASEAAAYAKQSRGIIARMERRIARWERNLGKRAAYPEPGPSPDMAEEPID